MQSTHLTRRAFLASGGAALASVPLAASSIRAAAPADPRIRIYIFSKHLQWLDYDEFAETAVDIGFEGAEVTLRPGGHIEPERVEDDLPRYMEACRKHGLAADAAVTSISDPGDPLDARVLQAMSKAGIKMYRLGGWRYEENKGTMERLNEIKPAIRDIVQASKELGMVAVYQNHSGARYVGCCIWDIYELIRDADTDHIGFSFDIGHATIEGGYSWINDAKLALPLTKNLVIKDFTWQQTDQGWRSQWCPLGEGMVDTDAYFKVVARSAFRGFIAMHFEYPTPGNTHVNWYRNHIRDQRRDRATLQRMLEQAGLR